jgi:hypothetical protein
LTLPIALPTIAAAIVPLVRRVEVLPVLLGAGLLIAAITGKLLAVANAFAPAWSPPWWR